MLKPEQQIFNVDYNWTNPYETERGGFTSLMHISGIYYATYDPDPSDQSVCLGVQQYNFDNYDLAIEVPRFLLNNTFPPFSSNHVIREGVVITNFIHPSVSFITPGSFAYLAPSGLVTAAPVYTNIRVGRFESSLNSSELGLGGSTDRNNYGPIYIPTAGWARIHIQMV
jgi:hypothetical protein